MKKFLLSLAFLCALLNSKGQTVLNEIYTDPGDGNSEFFELYNSGVAAQNVDCYTLVTYWGSGNSKGWYVIDLPAADLAPKGYFTGAAAMTFKTQNATGNTAHFSWNDAAFRNGSSGGSIKKWQLNSAGTAYTAVTVPDNLNDIFSAPGSNDFIILVFVNGGFNNGFIAGSNANTLAASIGAMPALAVDMASSCQDFTINFSLLGAMENVNSKPGTNNGFARTSDGKCGAWSKTAPGINHTPGKTNGSAANLAGALSTTQELRCNTPSGFAQVAYNITGVTGSATEADDFAVDVMLYEDKGTLGQLDGADVYVTKLTDNAITEGEKVFTKLPLTQPYILIYKTKRGCFDKVVSLLNQCSILPVKLKSFNAKRNKEKVHLTWETSMELNNSGFDIQRKVGNGEWKTVAFMFSKANGGNSNTELTYEYTDINTSQSVTQYRLRQVDIDTRATLSEIRTIRGQEQISKILIYPNPSTDGKVNLVFEERHASRNVSITDLTGRVVKQYRSVAASSLQIENLLDGIYTLHVTDANTGETTVEKIIIKKR